ncbi:hypothetical protein B566_EDAN012235 [Ephemera danica]|nr:hypothetical protein B566_EDAN012235 [Ephemera danica]
MSPDCSASSLASETWGRSRTAIRFIFALAAHYCGPDVVLFEFLHGFLGACPSQCLVQSISTVLAVYQSETRRDWKIKTFLLPRSLYHICTVHTSVSSFGFLASSDTKVSSLVLFPGTSSLSASGCEGFTGLVVSSGVAIGLTTSLILDENSHRLNEAMWDEGINTDRQNNATCVPGSTTVQPWLPMHCMPYCRRKTVSEFWMWQQAQDELGSSCTNEDSGQYDAVVVAGGMGEGHIPVRGFDEMARLLKPGKIISLN